MLALFIAVSILENLKALDAPIHMFNEHPVAPDVSVKLLLQFCQRMFLG